MKLNIPPWRIRNLKYLEIKIEEWPNRAKLCQMVPNGAKQGQTGSNGAKKGQKGPTEPNGAKRGHMIFMILKNHVKQPRPSE